MQWLFLVLALMFSASLPAQAPTAVPLREEPYHHFVFENDYVRVFRVSVPAHDATLLHQHDVPYLYISLGTADVINAVQGRPEARLVMADGQLGYSPGHFAHIARTDAGIPFNNVTIELLKPQGEPRNRCAAIIEGPLRDCFLAGQSRQAIAIRAMNMPVPMFETDELRVEALLVEAGGGGEVFLSPPDPARLLISLNNARVRVHGSDQMWTNMHPGDDIWVPSGTGLNFERFSENAEKPSENKEAHFLVLSFKDSVVVTKKP